MIGIAWDAVVQHALQQEDAMLITCLAMPCDYGRQPEDATESCCVPLLTEHNPMPPINAAVIRSCSPVGPAGMQRHPAHRHPGTGPASCSAPPQQLRQPVDRPLAWRAPRCRTPAERRAADQECSRRWRLISSSVHVDDPAIESTTPLCKRVTTVQVECLAVEPH